MRRGTPGTLSGDTCGRVRRHRFANLRRSARGCAPSPHSCQFAGSPGRAGTGRSETCWRRGFHAIKSRSLRVRGGFRKVSNGFSDAGSIKRHGFRAGRQAAGGEGHRVCSDGHRSMAAFARNVQPPGGRIHRAPPPRSSRHPSCHADRIALGMAIVATRPVRRQSRSIVVSRPRISVTLYFRSCFRSRAVSGTSPSDYSLHQQLCRACR